MLKCKCGGQFRSIDIVEAVQYEGRTVYTETRIEPGVATRRCNKCGKLRLQPLRRKQHD